jgi:hypothetical protein
MSKTTWIIIIVIVALAAIAAFFFLNQPTEKPATAPAPNIPAELQPIAEKAIGLAASTFHVKPEEVQLLSIEAVQWGDTSLGCPQEGQMYAQQLTSGYLATVDVGGKTHAVHMNEQGQGVVCPPEQAKPPVG